MSRAAETRVAFARSAERMSEYKGRGEGGKRPQLGQMIAIGRGADSVLDQFGRPLSLEPDVNFMGLNGGVWSAAEGPRRAGGWNDHQAPEAEANPGRQHALRTSPRRSNPIARTAVYRHRKACFQPHLSILLGH